MKINRISRYAAALLASAVLAMQAEYRAAAVVSSYGGGYAVTGQISGVSYSTEIYDAVNGLPTSDAMFLMSAGDGRMWIGGYSGVFCYDGSLFERVDTADGLTSARAIFEDSKGRIWVGTNDNGVVVLEGQTRIHLTYLDGLPSSSIRIFEEDPDGNVFIGTTAGICFADSRMKLHEVAGADFSEERILKLDADSAGRIYGQASSGTVFTIDDTAVTAVYSSEALAADKITTLMADPDTEGKVYFGTESGIVYHGVFGVPVNRMDRISIPELGGSVHWLSADCGRVWVSSVSAAGWLDHHRQFHLLDNIPMNSGIEMTTADYQGNLWFASSTQGIMKLVTNNFVDVSREAGIAGEVANASCLYQDALYIGTDTGLEIINAEGAAEQNALTEYIT